MQRRAVAETIRQHAPDRHNDEQHRLIEPIYDADLTAAVALIEEINIEKGQPDGQSQIIKEIEIGNDDRPRQIDLSDPLPRLYEAGRIRF